MNALRTLGRMLVAASIAAAAVGGLSASASVTRAGADGYWIVLGSDRDGDGRAYSMRPDGSHLTPLLPLTYALEPTALSRNGRTIAYEDLYGQYGGGIFVSGANGSGLRQLVRDGISPVLSPDGRLLAFETGAERTTIWIIGVNGQGRRSLTSARLGELPDWSPDGKALVFSIELNQETFLGALVEQPLHGSRRVLVRDVGIGPASWSPDGRWIAYEIEYRGTTRNDLYLVHPNGQGRHRVARGSVGGFAWSPDGKRLAFGGCGGVCVMGIDGQGLRRLQLHGVSSIFPTWSPDGRLFLALASSVVWVVRVDGHGLRRVKTLAWRGLGAYSLIGWTRLAPVLPPAAPLLPSEHVLDAETVATRRPVAGLSADGPRVAFVAESTAADCDHVVVWTPAAQALDRFRRPAPCGPEIAAGHIYDVELAGSRAAWADVQGCGNYCDVSLKSATLAEPLPLLVNSENGGGGAGGGEYWDFHVHGHGDLLVFDDGSRLVRIGVGSERCQASICTTLRRGDHAAPVESVSAGLIAIREPDAVAVVDAQGNLVRVFPFPPDDVTAVRLDGGRLVVARLAFLETYDVASGALELSRALPSGYRLEDVDGGIAVLRGGDNRIMLVRLVDGASFMLAPDKAPTFADLESPGLYYSYATPDGGRVVFMPRADVARHLDAGS